jgi:hypothetical protein
VQSVRSAFHVDADVVFQLIVGDEQADMRDGMIRVIEEQVRPAINSAMLSMNRADGQALATNLVGVSEQSDHFMGLFERDLDNETFKHLLDLQAVSERIVRLCTILPDVLGVPPDLLEPLTESSSAVPLQSTYNRLLAKELDDLLVRCVELLSVLRFE